MTISKMKCSDLLEGPGNWSHESFFFFNFTFQSQLSHFFSCSPLPFSFEKGEALTGYHLTLTTKSL